MVFSKILITRIKEFTCKREIRVYSKYDKNVLPYFNLVQIIFY
jgi:hypothetical protein